MIAQRMRRHLRTLLVLACTTSALHAQQKVDAAAAMKTVEGLQGNERAEEWMAERLREAGLAPLPGGSYFHEFQERERRLRNVGGVRSESAHTRSTESGPGRCRRSRETVLHWCSRRSLAWFPRVAATSIDMVILHPDKQRGRARVATRGATGSDVETRQCGARVRPPVLQINRSSG